jgi:RHS repeat-associated protein
MRRDAVSYFLVKDHVRPCGAPRTTSLVLDGYRDLAAETRHSPYGEERWPVDGTVPTDYCFSGQRYDSYTQSTIIGIRWLDDQIGRWISPDPAIPQPTNPRSFNRLTCC